MERERDDTDPPESAALEVTVTPRQYRRRAVLAITVGLVLLAATVLGDMFRNRFYSPFGPIFLLGYGIYCARQARHQITATLLRIDRAGIHAGEGAYEKTWDDVIMVWVGSHSGLRLPFVIQPTLSIFTRAGVDFARRAGTRPSALYSLPLGGSHRVADLCRQLTQLSPATVVDGTTISRRTAAGQLRPPRAGSRRDYAV